jgi:hypothetical protein
MSAGRAHDHSAGARRPRREHGPLSWRVTRLVLSLGLAAGLTAALPSAASARPAPPQCRPVTTSVGPLVGDEGTLAANGT